jgi:hypothetical protein
LFLFDLPDEDEDCNFVDEEVTDNEEGESL